MGNDLRTINGVNAAQKAQELFKTIDNYQGVADELAKLGYRTKFGTRFTKQAVWGLVVRSNPKTYPSAGGHRKKTTTSATEKAPARRKPRRRPLAALLSADNTKWGVLRAVDCCEDFSESTKKALIGLILQEAYT